MFVTEIRPEANAVVLGTEDELVRNGMTVGGINLMKYASLPADGMEAVTKIRYKDNGAYSRIFQDEEKVRVEFLANVKGVAPGQSAVFYEGDDVVGGGIIHGSYLDSHN